MNLQAKNVRQGKLSFRLFGIGPLLDIIDDIIIFSPSNVDPCKPFRFWSASCLKESSCGYNYKRCMVDPMTVYIGQLLLLFFPLLEGRMAMAMTTIVVSLYNPLKYKSSTLLPNSREKKSTNSAGKYWRTPLRRGLLHLCGLGLGFASSEPQPKDGVIGR